MLSVNDRRTLLQNIMSVFERISCGSVLVPGEKIFKSCVGESNSYVADNKSYIGDNKSYVGVSNS